jgi:hypothetical protein
MRANSALHPIHLTADSTNRTQIAYPRSLPKSLKQFALRDQLRGNVELSRTTLARHGEWG